jgi:hypothetical protein
MLLTAAAATPARAQASRADSLEIELRRLRARMDSLERIVERLLPAERDTAAAVDELAALRAAARAATGTDTTAAGPDSAAGPAQDQGGNLNRLNPEISVTADCACRSIPTRRGTTTSTFASSSSRFSRRSIHMPRPRSSSPRGKRVSRSRRATRTGLVSREGSGSTWAGSASRWES